MHTSTAQDTTGMARTVDILRILLRIWFTCLVHTGT